MDPTILLTKTIKLRQRVENGEEVMVTHAFPPQQEKMHCFDMLGCKCGGCQVWQCCWPDIEDGPFGTVLVTHQWIQ